MDRLVQGRLFPGQRREEARVAEYVTVCRVEEVPEGRALAVEVKGLRIALFRESDTVHALLNRCPHSGGSMAGGWIEGKEAVCPLHHWRFRLDSGRCTTVPGNSLHVFPCEVRGGEVWVKV